MVRDSIPSTSGSALGGSLQINHLFARDRPCDIAITVMICELSWGDVHPTAVAVECG